MSKKKKLKFEIKKAMLVYYESGYTNTAFKVMKMINQAIDKIL